MSIQTEMLPVLAVCREAENMQRLVDEGRKLLERERWESWGRIGTLTREQIQRANNPAWHWDDYVI